MSARSLDDDDDDAEDDATRRRKWTEACGRDTLTSSGISTHFRLPATPSRMLRRSVPSFPLYLLHHLLLSYIRIIACLKSLAEM